MFYCIIFGIKRLQQALTRAIKFNFTVPSLSCELIINEMFYLKPRQTCAVSSSTPATTKLLVLVTTVFTT